MSHDLRGIFVSHQCESRVLASGVLRAPRSPLRQGLGPCTRFGRRRRPRMVGVRCGTLYDAVASFVVGNTKGALFVRCDSVRSTTGGCFPQKSLPATNCVQLHDMGDFAEPFPPPLRELFCPRRSSAPSRPARGYSPLDPRQGAPCTCPDPPFTANRSLSFSHRSAVENKRLSAHDGNNSSEKKDTPPKPPVSPRGPEATGLGRVLTRSLFSAAIASTIAIPYPGQSGTRSCALFIPFPFHFIYAP